MSTADRRRSPSRGRSSPRGSTARDGRFKAEVAARRLPAGGRRPAPRADRRSTGARPGLRQGAVRRAGWPSAGRGRRPRRLGGDAPAAGGGGCRRRRLGAAAAVRGRGVRRRGRGRGARALCRRPICAACWPRPPGAPAGRPAGDRRQERRGARPGRPWLPAVVVKRIDERRGRWMYPAGSTGPRALVLAGAGRADAAAGRFVGVRFERLRSPTRRAVARLPRVPIARRFVAWSARQAGGGDRWRDHRTAGLPALPLLLWGTPPGLELILRQEGVPFETSSSRTRSLFRRGRFVLFDGRAGAARRDRPLLARRARRDRRRPPPRGGWPFDPFAALVDNRARLGDLAGRRGRADRAGRRAATRRRSAAGCSAGSARRSPAPAGSGPGSRRSRTRTGRPSTSGSTSTSRSPTTTAASPAPGGRSTTARPTSSAPPPTATIAAVLDDLQRLDTQSHGHFHVVYRDPAANRRNLERAHAILVDGGHRPGRLRRARRGDGTRGSTRRSRHSAIATRPTSARLRRPAVLPLAGRTGSRRSCRCRSTRSARACSSRPASTTAGRSPTTSSGRSGAGSTRASRRSSTATPSDGSAGFPEVLAALAAEVDRLRPALADDADRVRPLVALAGRAAVVGRADGAEGRFEVQFEDWDDGLSAGPGGRPRPARRRACRSPGPRLPLRLDGLAFERPRAAGRPARADRRPPAVQPEGGGPVGARLGDRHADRGAAGATRSPRSLKKSLRRWQDRAAGERRGRR